MLIDKARGVVDFVVDHEVQVLLARVLADVRVGELLVRHLSISRPATRRVVLSRLVRSAVLLCLIQRRVKRVEWRYCAGVESVIAKVGKVR